MKKGKAQTIYFDVCTLCRPFDDQTMMRIKLETDAFFLILSHIENSGYNMKFSPVHLQEINAIEDPFERSELIVLLNTYGKSIGKKKPVRKRAEELFGNNFGIADAAHASYAERYADVFITCDDRLIKKCRSLPLNIPTMNPIEFCSKDKLK